MAGEEEAWGWTDLGDALLGGHFDGVILVLATVRSVVGKSVCFVLVGVMPSSNS